MRSQLLKGELDADEATVRASLQKGLAEGLQPPPAGVSGIPAGVAGQASGASGTPTGAAGEHFIIIV